MNFAAHRSLSQQYVFYERLKDDKQNSGLYSTIQNSLNSVSLVVNDIDSYASQLYAMAANELSKEKALLRNIFNIDLNIDLQNPSSVKQLIDTLNACLNLKSVYERNIELIKSESNTKSVISYFPTYFIRAWKEKEDSIVGSIKSDWAKGSKNLSLEEAAEQALDRRLPEVVELGIQMMFEAEPELRDAANPNAKNAYMQLINAIGKVQQSGSLANQLYSIYQLDELKNYLIQSMTKNKKPGRADKKGLSGNLVKNLGQRGGYTMEAIENTILNMVAKELNRRNPNITAAALHSGGLNVKADNMMIFNMDLNTVEKTLETSEAVNRSRNIELFNNLNNQLKDFNNGYIVYTSDKNYILNQNFERRGGFAGESISLQTYEAIMSKVHGGMDTFAGAILQTLQGAVGGADLKKELESAIAQDVAYLLFDDFESIGVTTTNAIHIFNLNGILIPLSFFLFTLAQATAGISVSPSKLVKVSISTPKIKFETSAEQNDWQTSHAGASPWDEQRYEALASTKVNLNFLSNFRNLIRQYL